MTQPPSLAADSTVSSRVVTELVKAVERAGVSKAEFVRAARIQPGWLESDDVRLRRAEVLELCRVALELTGDPALGLHWGEWLTANAFNLVSHLLAHASTLQQAVETLHRFGHLLTDQVPVELVDDGDTVELRCLDASDQALPTRRLNAEMLMLGLLRLVQHFGGPSTKIERACFEYPAPSYRAEYTRLFDGKEHFDQPFTALAFDRALLRARSPQKDEDLYATLSDVAERRLHRMKGREAYAVRVRQHLLQQPAPHRVAMEPVARTLGVSVRTLHRRLEEEGHAYATLANDAAALVAERLLDEGRTIQEAAHAMGFSKVSSFHRAFRRWTGTTPSAFRGQ